jgi:hypothetical protein
MEDEPSWSVGSQFMHCIHDVVFRSSVQVALSKRSRIHAIEQLSYIAKINLDQMTLAVMAINAARCIDLQSSQMVGIHPSVTR